MSPGHGGHAGPKRLPTGFWFWFLYGSKGAEHFAKHGSAPNPLGSHGIGHGLVHAFKEGHVVGAAEHASKWFLSPRLINKAVEAARMARVARGIMRFHDAHPSHTPNPEIFRLAFADLVKSPFYHQGKSPPGDSEPIKIAAEMQVRAIEELKRRIHEEMKAKKEAFELKGRLSAPELEALLGDAKRRAGFVSHYNSLARRLWTEGFTQGEGGTIEHQMELHREAKALADIAMSHATLYGRLASEFGKLAKEKI